MVAPVVAAAVRGGGKLAARSVAGRTSQRSLVTASRRNAGVRVTESNRDHPRARALRQRSRIRRYSQSQEDERQTPHTALGFMFYFAAGIAVMKDLIVDPVLDLLIAGGMALNVSLVGAVLGLPLVGIAWVGKIVMVAIFFIVAALYFSSHGGIRTSVKVARMFLWGIAFLAESFPLVGLLPITTAVFIFTALLQNNEGSGAAGMISGFVVGQGSKLKIV